MVRCNLHRRVPDVLFCIWCGWPWSPYTLHKSNRSGNVMWISSVFGIGGSVPAQLPLFRLGMHVGLLLHRFQLREISFILHEGLLLAPVHAEESFFEPVLHRGLSFPLGTNRAIFHCFLQFFLGQRILPSKGVLAWNCIQGWRR